MVAQVVVTVWSRVCVDAADPKMCSVVPKVASMPGPTVVPADVPTVVFLHSREHTLVVTVWF